MRGSDATTGAMFSYVDLEARVPKTHPLRGIREMINEVLRELDSDFAAMYATFGRPSIAPEKLLRGMLLQIFFTIRSERQLMEQLDYNLLFRWFVGCRCFRDHARHYLYRPQTTMEHPRYPGSVATGLD